MEREEIFLTDEEIKLLEEERKQKEADLILGKRNRAMEYFTFEDLVEEIKKGFSVEDFVDMALHSGKAVGEDYIVFRFKDLEELLVSVNMKEENRFLYDIIVARYEKELS